MSKTGILTQKGLRRKQNREKLEKVGYKVSQHHYSLYEIDHLMHIAMNRIARESDQDFYKVFDQIVAEMNRVDTRASEG